jgi:hypothetical protein
MTPTPKPPTRKQLAYLRSLAKRAGQTFAYPNTRQQASLEIDRLETVTGRGFSFAELEAERHAREANGDVPGYAPAFHEHEIAGYGSNSTWRERS